MRMEMPLAMLFSIAWSLMEAHRIGEARLEEIIVAHRRLLHDVGQRCALRIAKVCERSNMLLRQHQRLKRPHCPPRNHNKKLVILADDPLLRISLGLQVIAQQARSMLLLIFLE